MSIIMAALLAGGFWPFAHKGQIERSKHLIPAWHVDTERDRFTGKVTCRLYQGKRRRPSVSYARQSLAFAFRASRNTLAADFRVDGGPTRPWTSVYPMLVGAGATLPAKSMANPTSGFVILPAAVLRGASVVSIRSRPKDRPQAFSVAGLADALASARRLGCDPDYGMARPL